jgi:hypothetical protein
MESIRTATGNTLKGMSDQRAELTEHKSYQPELPANQRCAGHCATATPPPPELFVDYGDDRLQILVGGLFVVGLLWIFKLYIHNKGK